jgi:hypothetical protein
MRNAAMPRKAGAEIPMTERRQEALGTLQFSVDLYLAGIHSQNVFLLVSEQLSRSVGTAHSSMESSPNDIRLSLLLVPWTKAKDGMEPSLVGPKPFQVRGDNIACAPSGRTRCQSAQLSKLRGRSCTSAAWRTRTPCFQLEGRD